MYRSFSEVHKISKSMLLSLADSRYRLFKNTSILLYDGRLLAETDGTKSDKQYYQARDP